MTRCHPKKLYVKLGEGLVEYFGLNSVPGVLGIDMLSDILWRAMLGSEANQNFVYFELIVAHVLSRVEKVHFFSPAEVKGKQISQKDISLKVPKCVIIAYISVLYHMVTDILKVKDGIFGVSRYRWTNIK